MSAEVWVIGPSTTIRRWPSIPEARSFDPELRAAEKGQRAGEKERAQERAAGKWVVGKGRRLQRVEDVLPPWPAVDRAHVAFELPEDGGYEWYDDDAEKSLV